MFRLNKLKNWAHSSISDDKHELEVYQIFQNEIDNIKKIRQEYINEEGSYDNKLQVSFKGNLVSLSVIETLKNTILNNQRLSLEERIKENTILADIYREKLKELEDRIITMALRNPENVYLSRISSSLGVINTLLKRYIHLLAIQRSGVTSINNGDDLKQLEDSILIRISEINYRITTDTMKR